MTNALARLVLIAVVWCVTVFLPGGCVSAGRGGDGGLQRLIFTRHAEKRNDGSDDPALTGAGRAWAGELARFCVSQQVTGVIATPYRRTTETAWAIADAAGVRVRVVPISRGLEAHVESVARVIEGDAGRGNWLVVGHSNTIPALVERFGATPEGGIVIDESSYGEVFVVDRWAEGRVRLLRGRLGGGGFVLSRGGGDGI